MPPDTLTPLGETEIDHLVRAFYCRVRSDALLGPIFNNAIQDWDHHLGKLVDFWSSVMLGSGRYKGQPMAAHLRQATHMTPAAFERWLQLWAETTTARLRPAAAAALQEKAARIAESLGLGIAFHRERGLLGAAADAA
jgi:hemoglobin